MLRFFCLRNFHKTFERHQPLRAAMALEQYVTELLYGATAEDVLIQMRARYASDCTMISQVSKLKKAFMKRAPLMPGQVQTHPDHDAGLERLRVVLEAARDDMSADVRDAVRRLIDAPSLRERYLRARKLRREQLSEPVREALSALRLVPDEVDKLTAGKDALDACDRRASTQRLKKNSNLKELPFPKHLEITMRLLRLSGATRPPNQSQLILGLCAASGRRMAEICNGHSTFVEAPERLRGDPNVLGMQVSACIFTGQLKKGTEDAAPYAIPLLVPFELFDAALKAFRKMQGDVSALTNDEISARYQGNAHGVRKEEFPHLTKLHDLRAAYVTCAHAMFDFGPVTFNFLAKRLLGHDKLEESLNYNDYTLTTRPPRGPTFVL
jgi:hypothetical protein